MTVLDDRIEDVAAGLRVTLESHLPRSLPAGRPTAIFCFGHCFHASEHVDDLLLLVDGVAQRPAATGMPRRDLYEWLKVQRSYRSGFWGTIVAQPATGSIAVDAAVTLADGTRKIVPLGSIEVAPRRPAHPAPAGGLIAVAMATFEPEPELFRVQIDSLRAQTDERWRCVISDDGTGDERYGQMLQTLDGDERFTISRNPERLGPYRNFERALAAAPAEAELFAPCDQDDRWYPDKLATLRAALGGAQLVYSDQRLVAPDGRVLRASLWDGRRRDDENLASLLIANSVPGASALFRRELVDRAIPFPDAPGVPYHDHWLALAALASGAIAYVDRPLYDYVQHPAAVMADAARTRPQTRGSRGWRGAYFGGYIGRQVMARTLLHRCAETLTPRKRRALALFVAADRSALGLTWLALRPLRRFAGRDETLGGESAIVKGLLWRRLLPLAVGRTDRRPFDASFPDPPEFEQPRLRRWRAGA